MSCYLVEEKTNDLIVSALIDYQMISEIEAQGIRNNLVKVNLEAVNERYKEMEAPVFCKFKPIKIGLNLLDVLQVIKSIDCYNYQACDFSGFSNTLIYNLLNTLKSKLSDDYFYFLAELKEGFNIREIKTKRSYDYPYYNQVNWG